MAQREEVEGAGRAMRRLFLCGIVHGDGDGAPHGEGTREEQRGGEQRRRAPALAGACAPFWAFVVGGCSWVMLAL